MSDSHTLILTITLMAMFFSQLALLCLTAGHWFFSHQKRKEISQDIRDIKSDDALARQENRQIMAINSERLLSELRNSAGVCKKIGEMDVDGNRRLYAIEQNSEKMSEKLRSNADVYSQAKEGIERLERTLIEIKAREEGRRESDGSHDTHVNIDIDSSDAKTEFNEKVDAGVIGSNTEHNSNGPTNESRKK